MKTSWKPGTMIYPLPAVLVSCGTESHSNIFTVAWTGTLCTNPPMCYISVRPERFSYSLIKERMEFTINLTTEAMARLGRSPFWSRLRQVARDGADSCKGGESSLSVYSGIASVHRVQGEGDSETRKP